MLTKVLMAVVDVSGRNNVGLGVAVRRPRRYGLKRDRTAELVTTTLSTSSLLLEIILTSPSSSRLILVQELRASSSSSFCSFGADWNYKLLLSWYYVLLCYLHDLPSKCKVRPSLPFGTNYIRWHMLTILFKRLERAVRRANNRLLTPRLLLTSD